MGANAQTSVPAFTAGQVLTAAQMTQVNTGIPVFASSTERDAAFGGTGEKTLAEGQFAFLEDTNETQVYDGSSWGAVSGGKILQIVSTTKTDTFSTSSTSLTNITGLSASITPTSASSTVFATLTIGMVDNSSTGQSMAFDVTRAGTPVGIGDTASNRTRAGIGVVNAAGNRPMSAAWSYLDSPATTSATTYQVRCQTGGGTLYVNRSSVDTDIAAFTRAVSTLTVMEVSA
jgi:hypothetical protein